jgi:glycosyltransferase involved in cell wall biosynthesis
MNVTGLVNSLSLGGTEKAACFWAGLLKERGHQVRAVSLEDGPRRADLQRHDIPLSVLPHPGDAKSLASLLEGADIIHAHAPGFPHQGDILGEALKVLGKKIPVIQTNIFGKLENPAEDTWTDFRLFISWTSCVQAARRAGRKLDLDFFRRQSVAVYPMEDPFKEMLKPEMLKAESEEFRTALGISPEHVLYGRFSRPEPNKWTPLVLDAFLAAYRENPNIRLLLREPPPAVAHHLTSSGHATWFPSPNEELGTKNQEPTKSSVILMSATPDPEELKISQMACDVVLHTSSIGESFGYGIAEPMALGKPVITNSVPWHDQAQIELVRHQECGLIASTKNSMSRAILELADPDHRPQVQAYGQTAREHILKLANPSESTSRIEMAMRCAAQDQDNPHADQDLEKALKTEEYLDKHQWGHSFKESFCLRAGSAKISFMLKQNDFKKIIHHKIRI